MLTIAKTEETIKLEQMLRRYTTKMGVFGCFEVTIGWFGDERVDYMTYDTKGIWRCYEIKVSKSDFYSNAKKTFVGNYNYFVMPKELFDKVKEDIPENIGVFVNGNYSVKRAKKQEIKVDEQILKDSMIRSLSREANKLYKSEDPFVINSFNRRINSEQKEKERYREMYQNLMREVQEKYGTRWRFDG